MFGFSEQQIMAWLSPIIWPFLRTLAMFSVAAVSLQKYIPMRGKVAMAFVIALGAQATLIDQPVVSVNSPDALGTVLQQVGVGLAIGFAARLAIAAVEVAG